jgi:hypothetical protein
VRFEPVDAAAGAVLRIEMSALPVAFVNAVDVLLPGVESVVVAAALAVFEITAPTAPGLMWTVIENVAEVGASEAIVQLIVPVPPTAGVVHENVGPVVCDSETKVVFAGTASVRATLAAFEGPRFVNVMV